ncbi:MAG: hypothetical protein ACI9MR_005186 [Myxococcota bacterium]|jgi:hypothetical protein
MGSHPSPASWTVIDKDAGVLALSYTFTKGSTSNSFAARMPDGKMLVVSPAVRLTDALAAELTTYGDVGYIVANNGFHHLGQAEWRARFPEARCFAPADAMARIKKKNPGAGAFEPLSALVPLTGDDVGVREVPNSKCGESWVWARVAGGHAWYLSDVLANMPELPKALPLRLLFKWTKSAPGFRVFGLALKFVVKDKKATLRLLLNDMSKAPPTVIVPAHGGILQEEGLAKRAADLVGTAL